MMQPKFLIAFIAFLSVLGGFAFAQFNVSASVSPKNIGTAPCGIATYDILIKNDGQDDTFAVFVDGIPNNWYTLTNDVVQLKNSEFKTIYLFVTVDCFSPQKTYEGNITVKGQSESKAIFTLSVVPDHIINVDMAGNVSFCLCEEGTLPITINNRGLFDEEIDLSLSGTATSFASLTTVSLMLKADESKNVNLTVANSCEAEPSVNSLEVTAKSKNSYARDSATSVIRRIKCHDFEVIFDKEISTCAVEERPFSISVKNTGTKIDGFEIKIPSFNVTEKVLLLPNKILMLNSTFLTTNPDIYYVNFTVASSVTMKNASITFIAKKCYDVDLQVESNELTIVSGKGKLMKNKVLNKGALLDEYKVESSVPWASIRPKNLTLVSNESGDVFVYYSPEFGAGGILNTTLTAKSERSQDEEIVKINVLEKEANATLPTNTTSSPITPTTLPETTTTASENATTTIEIPKGNVVKLFSERFRENRFLFSIIIGILAAIIVFVVLYYMVMKGG